MVLILKSNVSWKSLVVTMSGSHFSMQTSKFLLINVTAVTMSQGHKQIISYISLYPYILCLKYVRFGTNGLEVRGKRFVVAYAAVYMAETNWKHKVTQDGVTELKGEYGVWGLIISWNLTWVPLYWPLPPSF